MEHLVDSLPVLNDEVDHLVVGELPHLLGLVVEVVSRTRTEYLLKILSELELLSVPEQITADALKLNVQLVPSSRHLVP